MATQLNNFPPGICSALPPVPSETNQDRAGTARRASWLQVGLVFLAVIVAVWTPDGVVKTLWMSLATVGVFGLTLAGHYTVRDLGLARPKAADTISILSAGMLLALAVAIVAGLLPLAGLPRTPPLRGWLLYAVWALLQQFLLQSFFYLRLEALAGRRWAVPAAAALFAAAHLPSPVLTVATLVGGLFFCEMFRRYRNIYALAAVHALLGLTVAATFPDRILHHMRVGIGYLTFHP